jgi:hypothetical protein
LGCKFDGWSEHFHFKRWMQAFDEAGLAPEFYNERIRQEDEVFPWDHIGTGATRTFLRQEYAAALTGTPTADCRRGQCHTCGVCPELGAAIVDWGNG